MQKHPEALKIYKRTKLTKLDNYGFAIWAKSEKFADKKVVLEFLKDKNDWNQVLKMTEVDSIFKTLDFYLFRDSSLNPTDLNLVTGIDLLNCIAQSMIEQGN